MEKVKLINLTRLTYFPHFVLKIHEFHFSDILFHQFYKLWFGSWQIFRILGTPDETIWPGFSKLPGVKVNFVKHK